MSSQLDEEQSDMLDRLIKFIENMSTHRSRLPLKLLDQMISNPSICNLSLSDKLIKHVMDYLLNNYGLALDTINFYKNNIKTMETQFPCMYMYYRIVKNYQNMNFKIFSLGSSLEKLNILWNTFNASNPSRQINEIPFSGSMYDYGENHTIILIQKKRDDMVHKYPLLLKNNPAFKKLVDTLNENQTDVLITDVKGSGKSLRTILYLFNLYKVNVSRLFFLYITTNYDGVDGFINMEVSDDLREHNYHNPLLYFNSTQIDPYFIKGEDAGARCIAHYQKEVWEQPPTPIFYDNPLNPEAIVENYRRCNFHTFVFMMFSACFFKYYVMPRLTHVDNIYQEGQDMEYVNRDIKEFIYSNISEEHKLELIRMKEEQERMNAERIRLYELREQKRILHEEKRRIEDEPDRKYLKYKLKYIKLKEKLKNFNIN